jgi:two-component system, OmpR family, response regulator
MVGVPAGEGTYNAGMNPGPHILIVDDDSGIRDLLSGFLRRHGYRTQTAAEGEGMFEALRAWSIDLVVLDLMLPGDDGLTLCRRLRQTSEVPVIMLTAMGEPMDRVVGLELGADDYIPKPCEPRELLARIRAVLRRSERPRSGDTAEIGTILQFEGFRADLLERRLTNARGEEVELTSGEFLLLKALLLRPGRVLSRDNLLDLTHRPESTGFDRSIDSQISRLRRKIEVDPARPRLIKTVRNAGYVLAVEVRTYAAG